MNNTNEMEVVFDSCSANERFARVAVAAFLTQLNPTVEEVSDVKTAVSEAVTNSIIHGYENEIHKISVACRIEGDKFLIKVCDTGKGIDDVRQAMTPMYTSRPDLDRSGMGFSFMEAFMDKLEVESQPGIGTTVKMEKTIGKGRHLWTGQSL
ncbi:MAG: anti-sigma F factor [Schaedlerella sp.]|nr:anti-sigma F factor [Lachnospiraceae bacterium]MDY4201929.1 anti-sigma F factor [Schaedlerella sp.]